MEPWRSPQQRQYQKNCCWSTIVISQHTEAVNFMRASSLEPTRSPEIINLKRAAFAVDYDHRQLTRIRTHMPGLLRGHS
eukprot:324016-Amphidinium_carterae.1